MAVELVIRPAVLEDALALAPRMRAEEVAEVRASGGFYPREALIDSLAHSDEAWTALFDGQVACMWGVAEVPGSSALTGRVGAVWLLTSDLVERYPKTFWRACRGELARLFERWAVLVNAIDARHEKAVRWARRLGFPLQPADSFGEYALPFHRFRVRREDVHV